MASFCANPNRNKFLIRAGGSVRGLAGLGEKMSSDDSLLVYRSSSQASFPRLVALANKSTPQLPSSCFCFLRSIHFVY